MAAASREIASAAGNKVLIEYVGGNSGNSSWWGNVTSTRYIAGGTKRVIAINPLDLSGFLNIRKGRKPVFRQFRRQPAVKPVEVPKAAAEVANPSRPDDLTQISGVGDKTAAKLLKAGFATFRELARTRPEQVAEVAGVSLRLATVAVKGARDAT